MRIAKGVWLVAAVGVVFLVGAVPATAQVVCPLEVQVSAEPSLTRMYHWTVDKSCDPPELWLTATETGLINYDVTCDATFTDGDFTVSGLVTITNTGSSSVTINSVSAVVAPDIAATVDCGVTFPYALAGGGGQLLCGYRAALPCTITRNVDVTVATTEGDCAAQAVSDFATANITEIDECVDVVDSWQGYLGRVCAPDVPTTFSYSRQIGPVGVPGDWPVTNTAHFTTNDTCSTGCDTCTVCVHIPCDECGCTRTPGYWKTHSEYGPAPYDATWDQLLDGADTAFFLSGKSYYQALWTPRRGNAYYILAFQYIGAELNLLAGASVPSLVTTAFDEAATLFQTYTPAQISALPGESSLRQQFIMLSEILGDYNEGYLGPGHCPG
jgi:hypothetical protein